MLRSLSRPLMLCSSARGLCVASRRNLFCSPPTIRAVRRKGRFESPRSRFLASKGFKIRAVSLLDIRNMSASPSPSSVAAPILTEDGEEIEFLPGVDDRYGGVIVEMKAPMDSVTFVSALRASLSNWRQQGKRGIWIKMPIGLVNLVQPAVEEGFWFHHAEADYLMLVFWIPDTRHTLPVNATHRVGVGACVMNDNGEVLVVQEKSGILRGTGIWKFPTGVVDEGEDIHAGAVREVKEETGVDTEFVEVLAFRQSHKAFFEKSDLFFVCLLRPLSFDIQKQESEIEAAQWMSFKDFASQPFVEKHELLKYMVMICLAKKEGTYAGFSPLHIKSGFSDKDSFFFLNDRDLTGQ
ncbi:Nudix hydrolase 2 [Acorus calamus]|uniref:Nudix hydrolase 2 n=1 Tax=Acorus calamus TaxID=4465 RepID=A0AAV9EBV8_ACOCL|nr:Nudix hydrolase 2 [Acorus calamus]